MDFLTSKQKQTLDYIEQSINDRGYPPTVREIGKELKLTSTSTVVGHLMKLETKGFIKRNPSSPRAIELIQKKERSIKVSDLSDKQLGELLMDLARNGYDIKKKALQ